MGKSDSCAAPDCNHTSRGFCSFYYFPTHNPWRTLWVEALKRPPVEVDGVMVPWEPTAWDRLCSCHFSNPPNPKSRRLDAKWVVPDIFSDNVAAGQKSGMEPDIELPCASEITGNLSEVTQLLTDAAYLAKSCKKEKSGVSRKAQSMSLAASGEKTQTLAEILSTPPQHPLPSLTSALLTTEPKVQPCQKKSHSLHEDKQRYKQTGMSLLQSQSQSKLISAIKNTVIELCRKCLSFEEELSIEGLVGITLDKRDVILLNLQEHLEGVKACHNHMATSDSADTPCDNDEEDPDWTPSLSSTQPKNVSNRSRKRTHDQSFGMQHRNPIPDWKRACGNSGETHTFVNPDISTDVTASPSTPVIKIEPVDPEEGEMVSELQMRLQSEIHAAQNQASIKSISSKIVRMVQPQIDTHLQSAQDNVVPEEEDAVSEANRLCEDSDDDDESSPHNSSDTSQRFTVEEKIEVVNTILNKDFTLEQASEALNIDVHRLGKWVNTYEDMVKFSTQSALTYKAVESHRPQFPELDERMCDYYMQVVAMGGYCSDTLLLKKACQIAKELELDNFKGSIAYLQCWKQRHFQLQQEPEYEMLSLRVRQVFKHAYEEGRECNLESIESAAVDLASQMDCDPFKSDGDWLRKWKMHYFCQDAPSQDGEGNMCEETLDGSVTQIGVMSKDEMVCDDAVQTGLASKDVINDDGDDDDDEDGCGVGGEKQPESDVGDDGNNDDDDAFSDSDEDDGDKNSFCSIEGRVSADCTGNTTSEVYQVRQGSNGQHDNNYNDSGDYDNSDGEEEDDDISDDVDDEAGDDDSDDDYMN